MWEFGLWAESENEPGELESNYNAAETQAVVQRVEELEDFLVGILRVSSKEYRFYQCRKQTFQTGFLWKFVQRAGVVEAR